MEKTLVLLKPDALAQQLDQKIIDMLKTLQDVRITHQKRVKAPRALVEKHYVFDDAWYLRVGQRIMKAYEEYGTSSKAVIGIDEPVAVAKAMRGWLVDWMSSNDVIGMILEGPDVIAKVRDLCGPTLPEKARLEAPHTIRALSMDTAMKSALEKRPAHNLIHASDSPEGAQNEVNLWEPLLK